jgi:hypothetical protein
MASLRQAAACIGFTGDISIARDLLGLFRGQLPPDPQSGSQCLMSLARQIELLRSTQSINPDMQRRHININVICLGRDLFTDALDQQIDYSIYRLHNIFGARGLGVGRVQYFQVLTANAKGYDAPTTTDQLEELSDEWSVPNDGIDVFIPFNMNVPGDGGGSTLGLSPKGGPCPGDKNGDLTGSVVGLFGSEQTSRSFAHEVGHYLGLGHRNAEPTNLMCQTKNASNVRTSVLLDSNQAFTVTGHCMAHVGCDL